MFFNLILFRIFARHYVMEYITGATVRVPLTALDFDQLEEDLVIPNPAYLAEIKHKWSRYSELPETLTFYERQGRYVLLPRNYPQARAFWRRPEKVKPLKRFTFKELLRDYQTSYILSLRDKAGAYEDDFVMSMPCGHGKTVVALFLIAERQERTFILVPTNFLADQWKLRCDRFLDGKCLRVTLKTSPEEIAAADLAIITYDLFNAREKWFTETGPCPPSSFGKVVVDEAHRVGAQSYYPIVNRFPSRYRLALTATFRRSDGMEKILGYVFGKVYRMKSVFPKVKTLLWDFGYVFDEKEGYNAVSKIPAFKNRPLSYVAVLEQFKDSVLLPNLLAVPNFDPEDAQPAEYLSKEQKKAYWGLVRKLSVTNYSLLDTFTAENARYRAWVVRTMHALMKSGRRPLLLSKRVSLLEYVGRSLRERGWGKEDVCIVTGKSKKFDFATEDLTDVRCVLGIAQLATEGLDIDYLDTLVLAHPIKDIEQAYGRIRRFVPGKPPALAIQPYNWSIMYNRLQNFKSPYFIENSERPWIIDTLTEWI